jgi:hypothetical protein
LQENKAISSRGDEENQKKRGRYHVTFFEILLRFSGLIKNKLGCREAAKNTIKKTKGKDDSKKVVFPSTFLAKGF